MSNIFRIVQKILRRAHQAIAFEHQMQKILYHVLFSVVCLTASTGGLIFNILSKEQIPLKQSKGIDGIHWLITDDGWISVLILLRVTTHSHQNFHIYIVLAKDQYCNKYILASITSKHSLGMRPVSNKFPKSKKNSSIFDTSLINTILRLNSRSQPLTLYILAVHRSLIFNIWNKFTFPYQKHLYNMIFLGNEKKSAGFSTKNQITSEFLHIVTHCPGKDESVFKPGGPYILSHPGKKEIRKCSFKFFKTGMEEKTLNRRCNFFWKRILILNMMLIENNRHK